MKANTPASKKAKGNRAEMKVAELYRRYKLFPKAQRMPMSGAMAFHKSDIFKGEADDWSDEVKCQETVKLWAWWKQASEQAGQFQKPILHITGNHRPILSVIKIEDYMDLRAELKELRNEVQRLRK